MRDDSGSYDMRKLGVLTAAAALAMALAAFGLAHPAGAFGTSDNVADGTGESPNSLDITFCSATSDGGTDRITVTMTLEAEVCSTDDEKQAHYRIHYDYTGFLVTDQTSGADACERGTTSDDTSMVRCKNNLTTKSTGPGADGNVAGATITFVVDYADLGLVSGDDVIIWCDTQRRGFVDAAPDRDGGDGCNKPETLDETLEITLD